MFDNVFMFLTFFYSSTYFTEWGGGGSGGICTSIQENLYTVNKDGHHWPGKGHLNGLLAGQTLNTGWVALCLLGVGGIPTSIP